MQLYETENQSSMLLPIEMEMLKQHHAAAAAVGANNAPSVVLLSSWCNENTAHLSCGVRYRCNDCEWLLYLRRVLPLCITAQQQSSCGCNGHDAVTVELWLLRFLFSCTDTRTHSITSIRQKRLLVTCTRAHIAVADERSSREMHITSILRDGGSFSLALSLRYSRHVVTPQHTQQ